MKILCWNVNGIRAVLKKGFLDFIEHENPDIICLQEVKANSSQVELDIPGYLQFWNSAERKGYSGTAIFSKINPINIYSNFSQNLVSSYTFQDTYGDSNTEGRVLTIELEDFFLNTVYTPNSKQDLSRLDYRHNIWDPAFRQYILDLQKTKPVITCGDFNVAHTELDLARPDQNHNTHGFTKEERAGLDNLLEIGMVDTFRMFNKEGGHYSWWSHFGKSREKNVGWRIDYFLASNSISQKIKKSEILAQQMGSDHAPIILEL